MCANLKSNVALECQLLPTRLSELSVKFDFLEEKRVYNGEDGSEQRPLISCSAVGDRKEKGILD